MEQQLTLFGIKCKHQFHSCNIYCKNLYAVSESNANSQPITRPLA